MGRHARNVLEENDMSFSGFNVVEKSGKPAKRRFSNPQAVRAVYQKLTEDDLTEARRRSKILKMYAGNLPYNPEELKQAGAKNIANINFLGMKGAIDDRADVILRLSSDTANLVEFRPLRREVAGPAAEHIATVVAEEFSYTLRDVGKFIPALAMMNKEADLYGLGPVTWATSDDYNPVALERAQVRFIGNGPVHSAEHDLFMFESVLPASYLFSILDNEDEAAAAGWSPKLAKEWLVKVFRDGYETAAEPGTSPGTSIVETQISLMRRNMFEEEHQFDELKVIHAFVREMAWPRGITHLIIPANAPGDNESDFLFARENAFAKMDECFMWFPYSISERYARSVRGLGSYLFAPEAAANRLKCAFLDSIFRNLTIMFTQASGGSQQALTLNEQGPFTFVPKEFTPVQNNVKPDLQSSLQAIQYVDSLGVMSVDGTSKGSLATTGPKIFQGSDRQSKAEVELQQRLRSRKDEALFTQRLQIVDKVVRQSCMRFLKLVARAAQGDPVVPADYPEVPEFIERCAKRDVPVEQILAIPTMYTVVTCRDLVLGSEGKVAVLGEILGGPGAGILDETGRRNAMRDAIQLRCGVTAADRYIPEVSRDRAPSDQSSFAALENDMLELGRPVRVGQDQLHWAHIPVHAEVLQRIVEAVGAPEDNSPDQGEGQAAQVDDPRQALSVLVSTSQHIQEHLAIGRLQPGMEAQTKQIEKMLRDLRPTIKSLNLAVATQERVEEAERERQQRELEDLQRRADENEVRKAQIEADKKAETERYRIDREHEVALHKLGLEREAAGARQNLDAGTAAADAARKDATAAADIERQRRMDQAKLNAARAVRRFNSVQDATGFGHTSPADVVGGGEEDFSAV